MEDHGLPCLEMLEATPAILRGLMCELSEEDARWKPAPDRLSVAEVLAHLSHSEGHCFRMRVDRLTHEERPEFEPDDAQLHLERYRDPIPKRNSPTSRNSATRTWSICAACPPAPDDALPSTSKPAKSP
jgi:hypothetical protein